MQPDYRAWVVDLGKHFPVVSIDIRNEANRIGLSNGQSRLIFNADKANGKFHAILQAYTGFKDAKGTKIYEGDVLQDDHNNTITATWDSNYGIWEDEHDNQLYELAYNFTIVGHIHDEEEFLGD